MIDNSVISNMEKTVSSLQEKVYSIINAWDFLINNKEVKRFSLSALRSGFDENLHSYRKNLIKIKNDINEYFEKNTNMFDPDSDAKNMQININHRITEILEDINKEIINN